MNSFDYFFENTSDFDKNFLVGNENISFHELHDSALNIAKYIRDSIGKGKNIVLLSVNNVFFLKIYLAILKSGNICIPLDPKIEKDNYRFISDLTEPDLIFATPDILKRLAINNVNCITPTELQEIEKKEYQFDFSLDKSYEECAEIIFTSGSTGEPKGVMISHKNLIANTKSIVEYLKLDESDRMMVVLPFYYCYGLSLLHTHLRAGGSIVFNNSFIFLGRVINDLLEYKCTGFAGVPSHFQILLRKSDSFKNTEFPHLRYVTQAGGKLATVFIKEFRESQPNVKFIVMYGQTEATARLSYISPGDFDKHEGSMGKGIPYVELKVMNEKMVEVKPGEIGEIMALGDNVMMGYYKDPELTDSTLKNGWLHTGDLATVDEDGFIYVKARKKEIIKVGGKRVSPKEIEEVILQMPEVVDCSLTGVEDELLGETLKAKMTVSSNIENKEFEEKVKQHCSKNLALFKIPQIFEITNNMTISATGKKKIGV